MAREWEYASHPQKHTVDDYCKSITVVLQKSPQDAFEVLKCTKPSHMQMFQHVAVDKDSCFAGNYRGSMYPDLVDYGVKIGPFEGTHPFFVEREMDAFHRNLISGFNKINQILIDVNAKPIDRLIAFSKFVAESFSEFLIIHPYANGNGHISRLLVWCLFFLKSVSCSFWQVSNRNPDPADILIGHFRNGYEFPLIAEFLRLIAAENLNNQKMIPIL